MDNMRGQDGIDGEDSLDYGAIEAPPVMIATDERRMHVRAYNYWASLLGNRALPSIEDLNPEDMNDFSANSVLLDFSMGMDNPAILYLGSALREECGISGPIERIDQVPARSLLTRLTDHYLQIIANAAPVGFEAEFTNQRNAEIMYRGILMPFSSDDETIDFIYGVISWKEVASQSMIEGLDEEIRGALGSAPAAAYPTAPIWADGPSATADFDDNGLIETGESAAAVADDSNFGFDELSDEGENAPTTGDDVLDLHEEVRDATAADTRFYADAATDISAGDMFELEQPSAADHILDLVAADGIEELTPAELEIAELELTEEAPEPVEAVLEELDLAGFAAAEPAEQPAADHSDDDLSLMAVDLEEIGDTMDIESEFVLEDIAVEEAVKDQPVLSVVAAQADILDIADVLDLSERDEDLAAVLDIARQGANEVRECDARSRTALYRAIGLAYDFALSARNAPEDYVLMLENAGITVQDRSPMTAVIKLVFGADYEKTRVAEYALALEYAMERGLDRGSLAGQLGFYEGGLKGLVNDMRAARHSKDEGGPSRTVRRLDRAVRKLNRAQPAEAMDLPFGDLGLAVVVARREEDGSISLLAGVGLQDKAAQKVMIAASKSV